MQRLYVDCGQKQDTGDENCTTRDLTSYGPLQKPPLFIDDTLIWRGGSFFQRARTNSLRLLHRDLNLSVS